MIHVRLYLTNGKKTAKICFFLCSAALQWLHLYSQEKRWMEGLYGALYTLHMFDLPSTIPIISATGPVRTLRYHAHRVLDGLYGGCRLG